MGAKFGRGTKRSVHLTRMMSGSGEAVHVFRIAANQPSWLDHEAYVTKIQPLLARLTFSAIKSATHVSEGYEDSIRKGNIQRRGTAWRWRGWWDIRRGVKRGLTKLTSQREF